MEEKKQKLILTEAAVKRAGVSKTTIYTWCEKYRIGFKVGGRWRIYSDKLNKFLKGEL